MGGMFMLLRNRLWQKMYFKANGSSYISSSKECVEHVSTSEHAGYIITGMIINLPTIKTLHRPLRCPIDDHIIKLRSDKEASTLLPDVLSGNLFHSTMASSKTGETSDNGTLLEESITKHPLITENGKKQIVEKALPSVGRVQRQMS
jgi:hypothetical protein